MSYYIRLFFIDNVDSKDVFNQVIKVKKHLINNYKSIVDSNFEYRPSLMKEMRYTSINDYKNDLYTILMNKEWLKGLFSIDFIYYSNLKLLAFTSCDKKMEDVYSYVEFQNSVDQDYTIENYHGLALAEEYFNNESLSYIQRTRVYEQIEDTLSVKKYLFNKDDFDDDKNISLSVKTIDYQSNVYKEIQKYFIDKIVLGIESDM